MVLMKGRKRPNINSHPDGRSINANLHGCDTDWAHSSQVPIDGSKLCAPSQYPTLMAAKYLM